MTRSRDHPSAAFTRSGLKRNIAQTANRWRWRMRSRSHAAVWAFAILRRRRAPLVSDYNQLDVDPPGRPRSPLDRIFPNDQRSGRECDSRQATPLAHVRSSSTGCTLAFYLIREPVRFTIMPASATAQIRGTLTGAARRIDVPFGTHRRNKRARFLVLLKQCPAARPSPFVRLRRTGFRCDRLDHPLWRVGSARLRNGTRNSVGALAAANSSMNDSRRHFAVGTERAQCRHSNTAFWWRMQMVDRSSGAAEKS